MIRMFQVLAAALILVAAYFLYKGQTDIAFVTGVLAVCAFFLSVRFILKPRASGRNIERERLRAEQQDAVTDQPDNANE